MSLKQDHPILGRAASIITELFIIAVLATIALPWTDANGHLVVSVFLILWILVAVLHVLINALGIIWIWGDVVTENLRYDHLDGDDR